MTHMSSQDLLCSRKASLQCSICKSFSTKSLPICESGHAVCENCQTAEGELPEGRHDSGDCVDNKILISSNTERRRHRHHKSKKQNSETACAQAKDLASGDHDKRDRTSKMNIKSKSEYKLKTVDDGKIDSVTDIKVFQKKSKEKPELETIIEYKNANYHDSKSSDSSVVSLEDSGYNFEGDKCEKQSHHLPANFKACPRPVVCPVFDCGKMIAMDSAMLHFYFDHSKVPRIQLNSRIPLQIQLLASKLTMKTQCLTIFLLQHTSKEKSVPLSSNKVHSSVLMCDSYNNDTPLLLMGVRMQIENFKSIDKKSNVIAVRNVFTQTEFLCHQKETEHTAPLIVKENIEKDSYSTNDGFYQNEVLLLWICKVDDTPNVYSITLLKDDKKQGNSYIGETIHIRDKQDALSMYQRAECLILRGIAANRLLDKQNQIIMLVNILE